MYYLCSLKMFSSVTQIELDLPGLLYGIKIFQYFHLPKKDLGKCKGQAVDVYKQEIFGTQMLQQQGRAKKEEENKSKQKHSWAAPCQRDNQKEECKCDDQKEKEKEKEVKFVAQQEKGPGNKKEEN